ncbi:hypothetical protein LSAT2_016540 [Lamellibrachia satsuma]|nr:hypothetical protein LSAT2_016540 [Lamellibrachia satsuma]
MPLELDRNTVTRITVLAMCTFNRLVTTVTFIVMIAMLLVWQMGEKLQWKVPMTRLKTGRLQFKPPFVYNSPASTAAGKSFNVSIETVQSISTDIHSTFTKDPMRLKTERLQFKPPFVYSSPASPAAGKPFNVSIETVQSLHLLPDSFTTLTAANAGQVVIVTGASSDHFLESMAMIASVQKYKPDSRIIYYDLGLKSKQAKKVRTWCQVTLRKFGNPAYPKHVTEKLRCYAFKLLIVQEVLREFPGMFWMDASIRLLGSDFSEAYDKAVQNGGFVIINRGRNKIFTVTHPNLYEFLPTNIERLKQTQIMASGFMLIYNTHATFKTILRWMYLCALDVKCTDPPTSTSCHWPKKNQGQTYANCHRYDQSIVNVLAVNRSQDAYVCAVNRTHNSWEAPNTIK